MDGFFELNKNIHIEGLYSFFYFEHGKDFYYVGEKHDFWELVYVDSGEISAVADNNGYILSQGDVIFHKPMEFHGMTSVNGKPHNVFILTFEIKSQAMDFFKKKIFKVNSKQKKILATCLEEMRNAFGSSFTRRGGITKLSQQQEWAYQIGISCIERFLLELMRESTLVRSTENENQIAKKNIENALVTSIKDYMYENIYNSITLEDICKKFCMSKSYICQLFKNETGTSVIDYYIGLKMTEAKYMIREGRLNFTQISERLGYASLHHFTRIFKTKEKMSPSLYEKSIK